MMQQQLFARDEHVKIGKQQPKALWFPHNFNYYCYHQRRKKKEERTKTLIFLFITFMTIAYLFHVNKERKTNHFNNRNCQLHWKLTPYKVGGVRSENLCFSLRQIKPVLLSYKTYRSVHCFQAILKYFFSDWNNRQRISFISILK